MTKQELYGQIVKQCNIIDQLMAQLDKDRETINSLFRQLLELQQQLRDSE